MKPNDLFPVAREEHNRLKRYGPWRYTKFRARYTGEKRCPKRGEWFLSGSKIEAYYAPNDLTQVYHIAELVLIQERIVEDVLKVLTPDW